MKPLILLALLYGPYQATVVDVIDAETIRVNVSVWPGQVNRAIIGVLGVDTPSLKGKCEQESLLAKEALEFTRGFVSPGIELQKLRQSKNGLRYYAEVVNQHQKSLGQALLDAGYAQPYEKGQKPDFCPTATDGAP